VGHTCTIVKTISAAQLILSLAIPPPPSLGALWCAFYANPPHFFATTVLMSGVVYLS